MQIMRLNDTSYFLRCTFNMKMEQKTLLVQITHGNVILATLKRAPYMKVSIKIPIYILKIGTYLNAMRKIGLNALKLTSHFTTS